MCIICVKPSGVEIPDKKAISNCWDNNPDGSGIMYREGNRVIGKKGFMKLKQLRNALELVQIETELVIHFRWATHGLRDATATHPFPVSIDTKLLTAREWDGTAGIAHNGIIAGYGTKLLSDTQDFIKKDLGHFGTFPDRPEVRDYIQAHGGKYALMTAKKTYLIGDFIAGLGCFWSNSDYKTAKISWSNWKGSTWKGYQTPSKTAYWYDDQPLNTDICKLTGKMSDARLCNLCEHYDYLENFCYIADEIPEILESF